MHILTETYTFPFSLYRSLRKPPLCWDTNRPDSYLKFLLLLPIPGMYIVVKMCWRKLEPDVWHWTLGCARPFLLLLPHPPQQCHHHCSLSTRIRVRPLPLSPLGSEGSCSSPFTHTVSHAWNAHNLSRITRNLDSSSCIYFVRPSIPEHLEL